MLACVYGCVHVCVCAHAYVCVCVYMQANVCVYTCMCVLAPDITLEVLHFKDVRRM